MSRYATMFDRLGGEGAFGAFLMLGDPDLETSARLLDEVIDAGADMIEVGIPFSDPVADGPVIQAAAQRAPLCTEHVGVPRFVARMVEIALAQPRIGGEFGRTHQIAPAARFHLGEFEQFARASLRVRPDQMMERPQQDTDRIGHEPGLGRRFRARPVRRIFPKALCAQTASPRVGS